MSVCFSESPRKRNSVFLSDAPDNDDIRHKKEKKRKRRKDKKDKDGQKKKKRRKCKTKNLINLKIYTKMK